VQVDREEWATLSRLLDEALDVSLEARERWLEALPPAHALHKEKLRALLRHDVGTETRDFRDIFPNLSMAAHGPSFPAAHPGTTVGPYVLEAEIGRGGMGVVWRARRSDGVIKRPVALKLPHSGLPGQELMERFEVERDILAQLAHPNIARLYDAGFSANGQPYLAIEYVAGMPLTEYCDKHQLDVRGRLRLFQQVLRAVQYAHGRLVIHRDLKPTNVIVGEDRRAMLLDFGIARLIAAEAVEDKGCHAQVAALTPDYAAPEQVAAQAITIASDIYSLGVLLSELLAGQRPYRLNHDTRGALEEAILNIDPLPPSQSIKDEAAARARRTTMARLEHTLRGDLDAIVLHALKKNPAERYATADAFLHDVEQYLHGEPVTVRAQSGLYRARKFFSRHKLGVAASGVAMAALLTTSAVALSQARMAKAQRDRALALSSRNEAVAEFVNLLITEAGGSGKPVTVGEMLARSEKLVNAEFRDRPEHRAAVLGMLGSYYHTSGKDSRAEPLLREAMQAVRGSSDDDLRRRLTCEHALSMAGLGKLREAATLLKAVVEEPGISTEQAAVCFEHLAYVAQDEGNAADALRYARLALHHLHQSPHPSPHQEAEFLGSMGYAEHLNGRNTVAERFYTQALEQFARARREAGPEAISVRNNWAIVSDGAGNPRRALSLYDETLRLVSEGDAALIPPYLISNRAHALEGLGRFEEAIRGYSQCKSMEGDEATPMFYAYCLIGLSSVTYQMKDLAAAESHLNQAAVIVSSSVTPQSPLDVAVRTMRARLSMMRGRYADAREELDAAIDQGKDSYLAAAAVLARAEVNLLEERLTAAEKDARRALTFAQATQGDLPYSSRTGIAWLMLGRVLAKQGHGLAAHDAYRSAITNLSNTVDTTHPMLQMARQLAGELAASDPVASRCDFTACADARRSVVLAGEP
jgi:serine/threonine-protein kinase